MEKVKAQFGESDTATARVLNRIGVYYYNKDVYPEAESLYKQALTIREKALSPEHPDVAQSLNNLANIYFIQGKFAEAEPLYKRALAIREKALGAEHPDVTVSLFNLANLYGHQGKYAEAEPLFKRALAIREKSLGPDHPEVAASLNSLAILYISQGKYAEAEPLFKRALAIREKSLGPSHPGVASSLNNLGGFYNGQGRYAEAEPLYKRALAILEKALGPEHPVLAPSLFNLANLYQEQGKYAEAEPLHIMALAIREKALGPEHPELAQSLNGLGNLYSKLGKYAEAEPLHKRALAIWEKALGPEHPDVAVSLNDLAGLYSEQGKYAEAEPLFKRALAIDQKALGPQHASTAEVLESFSQHYRLLDKTNEALEKAQQAFEIRKKNFRDGSSVMAEKDALSYSQFMRNSGNNYFSCYFDAKALDTSTVRQAADVLLSTKGQVSDEIFARRKSLVAETDSTTLALAETWRFTAFQLSNFNNQGPGEESPEFFKGKLDSLSKLKNELEADLARKSASFRKSLDYQNVSTERVAALLSERSVLVEYLKYDYRQLKPDSVIPRYLVLILDKKESPALLDLGKASIIEPLVAKYRQHITEVAEKGYISRSNTEEYKKAAGDLYNLIWKPVEKYVTGKGLVFIAPDGGLNLVSFAGLVDEKGSYLVEKYPLHYLSSGRDLIRLQDKGIPSERLLALGDPDYNASPSARLGRLAGKSRDSSFLSNAYASRNVRSGCERLRDTKVQRLPGTKKEVERIAQLWKQKADVYFGAQASEESFKAHAAGHQVLHLATHGYFLQGECEPGSANRGLGRQESYVGENPLLLSGLLLAGANLHGQGADSAGAEDGILTAEEVATMNLEGTKLVVLSACETGLGEVKQGEGVYGLRRAFQMAGARTVISALWKVPDEITAETMGELYSSNNKSLPERMRQLQLSAIKKLRQQGDPDHPYSWGAFIALGDWR